MLDTEKNISLPVVRSRLLLFTPVATQTFIVLSHTGPCAASQSHSPQVAPVTSITRSRLRFLVYTFSYDCSSLLEPELPEVRGLARPHAPLFVQGPERGTHSLNEQPHSPRSEQAAGEDVA